ncbi:MAG: formylglycine-generating enzyme family protein [Cyanobacteria bacterium J06560_6]
MPFTLRRTPATASYYTEALEGLDETIPLQMIRIPAGSFLMGSSESEPEREEREGPQHEVNVPPFFLARYPITQAQWRAVAAMPEVNLTLKPEPSTFKDNDLPVEQVSWYEAVEFCDRLSIQTGCPYHLPSEAEWEYACRAGTTTPFHFGKTLTTEVANYDGNYAYADGPKGTYRETTTPVGQFDIANALGLSDMHGNVYEWCQDHYDSYDKTPVDGSAWVTPDEDARRILRGGSWVSYPRICRSACRSYVTPDDRNNSVGFRVSCSAPRT